MVILGPQLYGRVYSWSAAARARAQATGGTGPSPGVAYWAGAAAVLLAEALHRGIPEVDLFKYSRKQSEQGTQSEAKSSVDPRIDR